MTYPNLLLTPNNALFSSYGWQIPWAPLSSTFTEDTLNWPLYSFLLNPDLASQSFSTQPTWQPQLQQAQEMRIICHACTAPGWHPLHKFFNKLMSRIRSSIINTLGVHKGLFQLFVRWSLWELMFIMPSCLYFGYWHKFTVCLQELINTKLQLVVLPTIAPPSPFIQMIFLCMPLSSVKEGRIIVGRCVFLAWKAITAKMQLYSSYFSLKVGWWQTNSLGSL